jgi:GNAT superfamily N-acetyltransferase
LSGKPEFSVRQATADDAPSIARVQVESWEAAYRGLIPDEIIDARTVDVRTAQWAAKIAEARSLILVACDSNGIIHGFASAQTLDGERRFQAYLQTLYVGPQFWRKGIGRQLLGAVCSRLGARGVRNLALRTMRLGDARNFYERLGARMVPEGIAHDAGKFDDVVYAFDDIASVVARLKRKAANRKMADEE